MEAFGGQYNATSCETDPRLNGTEFARLGYCVINFNNAVEASIFLYHLLIVNQWHVLTEGLEAVTSGWARLFTFCYVLLFSFVLLNVVIAFIIEAFILEFKSPPGLYLQAVIEKLKSLSPSIHVDIEDEEIIQVAGDGLEPYDEKDQRPRLRLKIGNRNDKSTDALLQRMFESEIDLQTVS